MKTVLVALMLALAPPALAQATGKPESLPAVKMYATSWCPYCAKARAYFSRRGVVYTEIDVEKSAEGLAEFRKLGGRGVPLIVVGVERMNGYSEARLAQLLSEAGY
jgi:glutaredoxin